MVPLFTADLFQREREMGNRLRDFSVTIPMRSRTMDFSILAVGIVLTGCAVAGWSSGEGAVLILIFPGIGFSGLGLWMMTRSRVIADPEILAKEAEKAVQALVGESAHTPEARAAFFEAYLVAALKVHAIVKGMPEIMPASHGRSAVAYSLLVKVTFEHTDSERVVLLVGEDSEKVSLYLTSLTDGQKERAEQLSGTDDPEQEEVIKMKQGDVEEIIQTIEKIFREVSELPADYEVRAWMRCIEPAFTYPKT